MSSKLPVKPVFIGLMDSGKSAIARRLVARLDDDIRLIDVDKHIVAKMGLSIPEIFEKYGEAEFRKMETEALKDIVPVPVRFRTVPRTVPGTQYLTIDE